MRIFKMSSDVVALVNGRAVLDPPSFRKQWTASRLVRLVDDTTVPLLTLIAEEKFGAWDPKTHMPVWKDKNCCNESFENVALIELSQLGSGRGRVSSLGVPAGTKEYWRLYNQAHKKELSDYRKRRYAEMKAVYDENRRTRAVQDLIDKDRAEHTAEDTQYKRLIDLIGKPPS